MNILDLPEDVLSIVYFFLEPKDYLAFCSASKVLHTNYQKDPLYWRTKTSSTFRTPVSPLLRTDGARWYSLYRRLKTQTRLYTWGQGLKGNLGHGMGLRRDPPLPHPSPHIVRGRGTFNQPPRLVFQRTTSTWPTEAHVPDEVGVIADLQCGGWSTIILSAAGKLYATGSINSANHVNVGAQTDRFEPLEYLTQSTSSIVQFAAGRSHVLGLTDDGEILSWDRINAKGLKVHSRDGGKFAGKPTRVAAGWGESSAYVPEVGLIYWSPLKNDQGDEMLDARQVKEKVIPNTARSVSKDGTVSEVIAHIVLEGLIIYVTSSSKVWASDLAHVNQEDTEPMRAPVQLPGYFDGTDELKDVQGSFRNFVVFSNSGKVLAGDVDYAKRCQEAASEAGRHDIDAQIDVSDPISWRDVNSVLATRPTNVAALQNTGVISVKFGDWHYQALHSDGSITSHGKEMQGCGALGLGEPFQGGKLRGMIPGPQGMRSDSSLLPIADRRGRQIWFEPEKRDWLSHLHNLIEQYHRDIHMGGVWTAILHDHDKQTVFSEWIEQEGRHWEDGPVSQQSALPEATSKLKLNDTDELHLKSYFALAIGAAGWHSGALVLVDDDKAEEVRQKWVPEVHAQQPTSSEEEAPLRMPGQFQPRPALGIDSRPRPVWVTEKFPRIRFPDGGELPVPPGEPTDQTLANAIRTWRDGMPTAQELGLLGTELP